MNISLTPKQEQFIQEQLKSGRYSTSDEVIAQALQLLEEDERNYLHWVEENREKVAVGIEQADKGQLTNGKVAIARVLENILDKTHQSQA
ncbi:type II toxin-antitoxin system ParD family antitoxin [Iningainema tapete]|uniref:Type II toxin-antitoxin system ParD family antitoxin n=1 Tax=Iningainema tapete BLCC-T55 TaxID=2748662 RepID=A0A8J6XIL7_9CYAN|nr:type II toxin-antitoxin system ParD family antitoxin [Iningainema tapete]MBD2773442.1 type II toxin-antitoxin system ParD family antitoxin [Iningainema tapete BLCC-T55]